MSIRVEVRTESGEVVGPETLQYHRIVSWDLRDQFPMLGYTNSIGDLILNSQQVVALDYELERILKLSQSVGPSVALAQLGAAYEQDDFTIVGWDTERDLEPLLLGLRSLCDSARAGEHRYLWFVGD